MSVRTAVTRPGRRLIPLISILLLSSPSLGASNLNGFPVRLQQTIDKGPPLAFDIDGDGRLELLVLTREAFHVLEADGNPSEGFPKKFKPGESPVTALTAGKLGGQPAVLFGAENKKLVVLDRQGENIAGFPLSLDARLSGPPVLADLGGESGNEIVFGTANGKIHVVSRSGKYLNGYPSTCGVPVTTAVTVGRFEPRGERILAFGDERGNLHVWKSAGKERKGFPFKAKYTISSQPVLGDIDDDGILELVFGSKDFKIYALNEDGSPVEGFPVSTGYRIYSTPALADLDGDGVVDIITACGDGKLYAHGIKGHQLKGFPVKAGGRLRASPVVGDLDFDGSQEIAVGTDKNRLVVFRNTGKRYPGFPVRVDDRVDVAPLLADLNGDGLIEVITASRAGTLIALKMIRKGKKPMNLAWPAEGRDPGRRATPYPNPARYRDLALLPTSPRTTDSLKLGYRFFDLDGDSEPATIVRWFRNGKHVPGFDGAREVTPSATRKHERWHFVVQSGPDAQVFRSPEVKIGNTPPHSPLVAIRPDTARTGDDLSVHLAKESEDADGDKVRYSFNWLKDRAPMKNLRKDKVSSRKTLSGQRWTVVVTPSDGESKGLPARASIVVANTVPSAAKAHLDPVRPTVTQQVKVVIDKQAYDADRDPVSYRYRWTQDGKRLNLPATSSVLPAGMVSKHSKVSVEVASYDGSEEGGKTSASTEVVNSPPEMPEVRIFPEKPKTDDDLCLEVSAPARDSDLDTIRYQVQWSRKSNPYKGPHAGSYRLPASETSKNEKWKALVTPLDEEASGKQGRAEVTIVNSPPLPARIEAGDARPQTMSDLQVKVLQVASDPDGDRIRQEVAWYEVAGPKLSRREIARGPDLFRLPASKTRKNRKYLAVITPSDGTESGENVKQWFEVKNTPPSSCQVVIRPSRPFSGQALTAHVERAPSDPDEDKIRMVYQWYRNDVEVGKARAGNMIDGKEVSRGQRWTVVATPNDGEVDGPGCTSSVQVSNRPPQKPEIALTPSTPTTRDALICKLVKEAKDPDGDPVHLVFHWASDGQEVAVAGSTDRIPVGTLKKGQKWSVEVIASDGELKSSPARASLVVTNSPPGKPSAVVQPGSPLSSDDLHCHLTGPTPDPDGDKVTHRYEWYLLGKRGKRPRGEAKHKGPTLPAKFTRKGQQWQCLVGTHDGLSGGDTDTAEVTVANAAPEAARIRLLPMQPKADQTLRCTIEKQAEDPDGDKVRYRFEWIKDGVVQSFAPGTDNVPARLTKADDIWQCVVVAYDGKLKGPRAESHEVVVQK